MNWRHLALCLAAALLLAVAGCGGNPASGRERHVIKLPKTLQSDVPGNIIPYWP
jgi:hypothetical protein